MDYVRSSNDSVGNLAMRLQIHFDKRQVVPMVLEDCAKRHNLHVVMFIGDCAFDSVPTSSEESHGYL